MIDKERWPERISGKLEQKPGEGISMLGPLLESWEHRVQGGLTVGKIKGLNKLGGLKTRVRRSLGPYRGRK